MLECTAEHHPIGRVSHSSDMPEIEVSLIGALLEGWMKPLELERSDAVDKIRFEPANKVDSFLILHPNDNVFSPIGKIAQVYC